MPDPTAALALLAEPGWRTLVDAGIAWDESRGEPLAAATLLAKRRPDAEPARRAAALELVSEGEKLARKLGIEERLLAVREAVEQASAGRVATWHAQQVPAGARVLEIGCGCGGDSLAIAHRAANLIATDLDPVRAACAHVNLTTTGLATARAVPGDGFELLAGEAQKADVVFADPDRRPDGRRSLDPEAWRPPLSRLAELARGPRRALVKAAPSLDAEAASAAFRVAYVSYRNECVEAFLDSHRDGDDVRAVLLPEDAASIELTGDRGDAAAGPLGEALYVADPAAIRARLLAELCRLHGLHLVDPGIAFLTGSTGADTPWLRGFAVVRKLALAPNVVAKALADLGTRSVRVHVRGVAISAPDLERILREALDEEGDGPDLDVFATRGNGAPIAVIARRLGAA